LETRKRRNPLTPKKRVIWKKRNLRTPQPKRQVGGRNIKRRNIKRRNIIRKGSERYDRR
jgi:hypothetical protein